MNIQSNIAQAFRDKFKEEPAIFKSPGRVNLIGEHTDYNNGFVLPAAIDKAVYVAITKRTDNRFVWYAYDLNDVYEGSNDAVAISSKGWPNYLLGVVDQLQKAGFFPGGFNVVIGGDVPNGAGMSSSAAVECSTIFALNELFGFGIDKISMVKMAQKAEHVFAGVMCGIMDQFASMMGKAGHVIKLDCRSLEYEYVPFDFDDIEIVLFDTKVKHSLASSEYNTRRQECEKGVAEIKKYHPEVNSLRDADIPMVEKYLKGSGKVYDRCKFVVEEIKRLLDACEDLNRHDLKAFGEKMFATHDGLSKLYEVSCPELDFFAACAKEEPAILGARMMGGGFGGCTINLIKKDSVEEVVERMSKKYREQFNIETEVYRTFASNGASRVS
ncbi:MAG: galactokinase [Bacteroidota bacterium]